MTIRHTSSRRPPARERRGSRCARNWRWGPRQDTSPRHRRFWPKRYVTRPDRTIRIAWHASGALSQSMSARNVSPFSVILSIFVIVRTSSIRRSRGSLADKEKTAAGSPNPNFTADLCRPSPRCSSLKYHAAIARAISVFDFLEAGNRRDGSPAAGRRAAKALVYSLSWMKNAMLLQGCILVQ